MNKVTIKRFTKSSIQISCDCFSVLYSIPRSLLRGYSFENINWLNLEKNKDTTLLLSNSVKLKDFEFSGLSKWYYLPENLKLAYDNNYLTFRFVGITTKRTQHIKYQYSLDGLDKHWSSLTGNPEATYNVLPPGSYTFKVKAVNSCLLYTSPSPRD